MLIIVKMLKMSRVLFIKFFNKSALKPLCVSVIFPELERFIEKIYN